MSKDWRAIPMVNVPVIGAGVISLLVAFWLKFFTPGFPVDEWLITLFGLAFIWWGGVIGAFS